MAVPDLAREFSLVLNKAVNRQHNRFAPPRTRLNAAIRPPVSIRIYRDLASIAEYPVVVCSLDACQPDFVQPYKAEDVSRQ